MLYGEKLKQALKTEQNAINKMYLNELILNWKKVETAFTEKSEAPILSIVTAVSEYTAHLNNPKFSYHKDKGIGFHEDHDIFKAYYLQDIAERMLQEAGIRQTNSGGKDGGYGVLIKHKAFNTALRLENNHYKTLSQTPLLELAFSNKYLHCGLEFDIQYRLGSKKNFLKTKLYIPLIVFYIEKIFTEDSFKEIELLRKDVVALNPNALLFCLTETVDRRFTKLYNPIKDIVYVTRAGFKGDTLKPLQPQVFLSLYAKLYNYTHKEMLGYDKYVPFGHIDLFQDIELPTEPRDPNKLSRRQQKKAAFEERQRQKMEKKKKRPQHSDSKPLNRNSKWAMGSGKEPINSKQLAPGDELQNEETERTVWIAPPTDALGLKFGQKTSDDRPQTSEDKPKPTKKTTRTKKEKTATDASPPLPIFEDTTPQNIDKDTAHTAETPFKRGRGRPKKNA